MIQTRTNKVSLSVYFFDANSRNIIMMTTSKPNSKSTPTKFLFMGVDDWKSWISVWDETCVGATETLDTSSVLATVGSTVAMTAEDEDCTSSGNSIDLLKENMLSRKLSVESG